MPYDNEYAHYRALHRIAQSPVIQRMLTRARSASTSNPMPVSAPMLHLADHKPSMQFNTIMSIDGSFAEAPLPHARQAMLGYISIAAVETDVDRLRQLDSVRPCDPQQLPSVYTVHACEGALTGANVVLDTDARPVDSVRRSLYELFTQTRWSSTSETLLDTYESVVRHSHTRLSSVHQRCPYADGTCDDPHQRYHSQQGKYRCPCSKRATLWSLDALRLYERLPHFGSNRALLAEVMTLLEHMWAIHYLRWLEQHHNLDKLRTTVIIMDGPLALYSSLSWLSHALRQELTRINTVAQKHLGNPNFYMAYIGIEKTGTFVEYAQYLIQQECFPVGTALLLTDDMIKQHIVSWAGVRAYGSTTAYGRKVLYRTQTGIPVVITTPLLNDTHEDVTTAYLNQFPRLIDSLALIETIIGTRYANAITPLVTAHAEASLPLHFGTRILSQLTRGIQAESHLHYDKPS